MFYTCFHNTKLKINKSESFEYDHIKSKVKHWLYVRYTYEDMPSLT